VKRFWRFCRRCAAYTTRENLSMFDLLVIVGMLRLLDQYRYWDAAMLLLFSSMVSVALKSMAGTLDDKRIVVTHSSLQMPPELNTAGFAKRVAERFNARR
jgi:hypothetical protein